MRRKADPWQLLGIDPTGDAILIRKAYAARLKQTRPDEDPAGFQQLLEARDLALRFAGRNGVLSEALDAGPEAALEEVLPTAMDVPSRMEELPETVRLVNDIPRNTYPFQVEGPWLEALAALDRSPLDQADALQSLLLYRLVGAMVEDLGPMPAVELLPNSAFKNARLLGPYAIILRSIERRLALPEHDTRLFELLDWHRAWYLFTALEIVARGNRAPGRRRERPQEVKAADPIWASAAFATDPRMLEYHARAIEADIYIATFSLAGLVFPLPTALHYRLYGFAVWIAAIAIGIAVGRISWKLGGDEYYVLLLGLAYPIACYSAALHMNAMRINALQRKVASLSRTEDLPSIRQKVEAWGKPNVTGLVVGIVLTAITILSFVVV